MLFHCKGSVERIRMSLAPQPQENSTCRIDSAVPTDSLINAYTPLAATYDKRWSGYLNVSLRMTIAVVRELPASCWRFGETFPYTAISY